MLYRHNNTKRINIFIPANSTPAMLNVLLNSQQYYSITGTTITFQKNASNNCIGYNTYNNIYIYNNL